MTLEPSDVRTRILMAGEEVFGEYGYLGSSLLKIAKKAGTSESGVVRLFDTKQGVFLAVMTAAYDYLNRELDQMEAKTRDVHDPVDRLMAIAATIFGCYEIEQNKIALIFTENGLSVTMLKGSEGQAVMDLPGLNRWIDRVTEPFRVGVGSGALSPIDPIAARELYLGMIEGTILGWLLSDDPRASYQSTSKENIVVAMRKLLEGLRAS